MLDLDTFLITLYTNIDDFCSEFLEAESFCRRPGRAASLSRSETMTLALFGQLARFTSERDFWRFALQRLNHLFPHLPDRTQFNRLQRQYQEAVLAFFHHLVDRLGGQNCAYEIIDRVGVATRWCNRRGVGWLPEDTDKGLCSRLGFFHGFHLLSVVNPDGILTGIGVAPASTVDQPLAEAVFAARHANQHTQDRRFPFVGLPCRSGVYVADRGFVGEKWHQYWQEAFGVNIISPPRKTDARAKFWPRALCRWQAGLRQMVETVHDKLLNTFRLARERPHEMRGFFARLSAKVALHNFCIYLNRQLGRTNLEFADLIGW